MGSLAPCGLYAYRCRPAHCSGSQLWGELFEELLEELVCEEELLDDDLPGVLLEELE